MDEKTKLKSVDMGKVRKCMVEICALIDFKYKLNKNEFDCLYGELNRFHIMNEVEKFVLDKINVAMDLKDSLNKMESD